MTVTQTLRKKPKVRGDTRERLVRIGTEILSEKGFTSAGLEEILEKAGVPKGSFYHYFDSKASFGLSIIDHYDELWAARLTRLFGDKDVSPLTRIHNYIDEAARGLEKYKFRRGCLVGNMSQEITSLDPRFRARIIEVFDLWTAELSSCLRDAQTAGELPLDLPVEEVARYFWFSWEGAILQAKLEQSVAPVERFRAVVFRSLLRQPG